MDICRRPNTLHHTIGPFHPVLTHLGTMTDEPTSQRSSSKARTKSKATAKDADPVDLRCEGDITSREGQVLLAQTDRALRALERRSEEILGVQRSTKGTLENLVFISVMLFIVIIIGFPGTIVFLETNQSTTQTSLSELSDRVADLSRQLQAQKESQTDAPDEPLNPQRTTTRRTLATT
jgi:hypothetical protein